jgi:hypothetical protein
MIPNGEKGFTVAPLRPISRFCLLSPEPLAFGWFGYCSFFLA